MFDWHIWCGTLSMLGWFVMQLYLNTTRVGQLFKTFWVDPVCNYLYTARVGQLSKTFWVGSVCDCTCIQQGLDSCPRHFGSILYATVLVYNKGWTVVQDILGWLCMWLLVYNKGWTVVQDILGWSCMQLYLYTTRVGQLSKTFWVDPVCNCICIQQGLDSCPRHFGLILYATVFVFNKGWTVVQDIFGLILYATVFVFNKGWTVVQDMLGWSCMRLHLYTTRIGQLSEACWVGPSCICVCIQQGLDSCPRHIGLVPLVSVFNKGWTVVRGMVGWSL